MEHMLNRRAFPKDLRLNRSILRSQGRCGLTPAAIHAGLSEDATVTSRSNTETVINVGGPSAALHKEIQKPWLPYGPPTLADSFPTAGIANV